MFAVPKQILLLYMYMYGASELQIADKVWYWFLGLLRCPSSCVNVVCGMWYVVWYLV